MCGDDLTRYKKYLDKFEISDEEKKMLVAAIKYMGQHLLDKKYGLFKS